MHGRSRSLLHVVPGGRVVRQVLHLSEGYAADARAAVRHRRRPRDAGRPRPPGGACRGRARYLHVWSRPVGAEPRVEHAALLPRGVRRARGRPALPRRCLPRSGWCGVSVGMSGGYRGVAVRGAHRTGRVRRCLPGDSRGQPVPVSVRSGMPPPVRGELSAGDNWRSAGGGARAQAFCDRYGGSRYLEAGDPSSWPGQRSCGRCRLGAGRVDGSARAVAQRGSGDGLRGRRGAWRDAACRRSLLQAAAGRGSAGGGIAARRPQHRAALLGDPR